MLARLIYMSTNRGGTWIISASTNGGLFLTKTLVPTSGFVDGFAYGSDKIRSPEDRVYGSDRE